MKDLFTETGPSNSSYQAQHSILNLLLLHVSGLLEFVKSRLSEAQ